MSKVLLVPLKESVSSPFAKNVCGPADLGPGPEPAEVGTEVGIVAIERNADLPHVVVGSTSVRTGRRRGPDHQGRRDGHRCDDQPYPSHRALLSPLRPLAGGA